MTRVLLSKVTRWNLTSPFPRYSTKSYSAQLQSAWSKPLLQRILLGLVGNIPSREKPPSYSASASPDRYRMSNSWWIP